jgi:hypothetical protein
MDFVAEPIFILSVCIGLLNILERVLRKSTKYNKLLEKIGKSREKIIALSEKRLSLEDKTTDETILNLICFIDDLQDLSDLDFTIPK